MGIENRVQKLIDVLNKLPDVETFSSCGGHENPEADQLPADQFFVYFNVKKTIKGWKTLELLVWAIHNTDFDRLMLNIWNEEHDKRRIAFEILGIENVEPNDLADTLESLMGTDKS